MNSNARFVIKPNFKNLSEYKLKYTDILTYITIRSFYNSKDEYCYPSYNTIANLAQLSKKFLGESIKRLDKAGFLDVWKIGTVRVRHSYMFSEVVAYQKVPYQIFHSNDLTANEKSMLLLLREYCNSELDCCESISEIASVSGLTYRTIHKQFSSLVLKGYISDQIIEDASTKSLCKVFKFTDKLNWKYTMTSSSYLIKAKASETQSKSLAIVSMAIQIFKNMDHSSRE
ncbi:helix-turn-helix domain-containing protein [Daejeonella oryzae]|uniref:helix-turn-helix domain-containing protein n=1 Tax=Daejeonella oryzae TaxID=1122943 RepID=UPI0003FDC2F4|nr:helix-turn-helix domain-containing protein [Daejeonella oryzae]